MANTQIVIVTYNGSPWIDDCLSSLRQQTRLTRTIVVDNASTDDTVDRVTARHPEVLLLRQPVNQGFGVGNNVGIRQAMQDGADLILLLNQDTLMPPGSLDRLVEFMETHAEIGVASPLHCSPDTNRVDLKTLEGYLAPFAASFLDDAVNGRPRDHYLVHGTNAAVWLVRSDIFRRVGGFDPLYFMYAEDDDLLVRMAHHGVRFALVPSVRVVHLRQSPVGPGNPHFATTLRRAAALSYSRLLHQVKRPGQRLGRTLMTLVAKGFLQPLVDALVDHEATTLLARWRAALRLTRRIGRVHRHARTTARPGPHFLQ